MRLSLHARILIGGLLGVFAGGLAYRIASAAGEARWLDWLIPNVTKPVGDIFIRLLLMLVVPLMFSALVLGVAELGDLRRLGRVGLKTLAYTVVVSAIAVLIGIAMVNIIRPGDGLSPDRQAELLDRLRHESERHAGAIAAAKAPPPSGIDMLVPSNPVAAAANGDYLAWMFFALMIGIGLCLVKTNAASSLLEVIRGLFDVCMFLIRMVIWLAPIGVAALLFNLTAQFGWDVLRQLGAYVAVVLAALLIHQVVVYSLAVKLLGGMNPVRFFCDVQDAMVMAFSTASSNATLPTALKVADENLKLPQHISRFVLTVGATANQNGTALFEGVTVLFLAQFYGIDLSIAKQFTVVFMCVLGGIGTAGVPAGSLPVVVMIMGMIGVPAEGIGLIIGIDRFLDMCRTTLNVTGDLAAAVVIARSEREELPAGGMDAAGDAQLPERGEELRSS